jgi:hypothetical protein
VAAPRGKPYSGSPWCLGPQDSPYALSLILTQEVARQPLRLILLQFSTPPPAVTTQPLQMLRLDRNSLNTEEGSPFMKMSVNYDVVRTWRTQT